MVKAASPYQSMCLPREITVMDMALPCLPQQDAAYHINRITTFYGVNLKLSIRITIWKKWTYLLINGACYVTKPPLYMICVTCDEQSWILCVVLSLLTNRRLPNRAVSVRWNTALWWYADWPILQPRPGTISICTHIDHMNGRLSTAEVFGNW